MKVNSLEDAGIPAGATPVLVLWKDDEGRKADPFGSINGALCLEVYVWGDAARFLEIRMGRQYVEPGIDEQNEEPWGETGSAF